MKKLSVLIAIVLVMAMAAAPFTYADSAKLDKGTTNASGYPIVDEEITLKAVANYSAIRPDLGTTSVWDFIRENTGINVECTVYTESDQVSLMFASRDYPDFTMNVGMTTTQKADAIASGDIVCLDELLETYAPSWTAFFEEQPLSYASALEADGHLYGLTWCDFAEFDRKIRDIWVINQEWLDQLNMAVPTTFAEFKDAMVAFKANAGTGVIPADCLPFYIIWNSWVSGQFDVINSFGVYVSNNQYLWVEDGGVVCQATNPAIKEPLKYLQELYTLGVLVPECFTDTIEVRTNRQNAKPCSLGSYATYHNLGGESYSFIGPLDAENGSEARMRSQTQIATLNMFNMFSVNEYPVATIRMCEFMVESPENVAATTRGKEGVFWEHTEDGKIVETLWENNGDPYYEASGDLGFWNSFISIRSTDYFANLYNADMFDETHRAWAYENVYKGKTNPQDQLYASVSLGEMKDTEMNQYWADLENLISTTFATWITTGADIDAEWDAFVAEFANYGGAEWLALKQEAYDALYARLG